MIERGWGMRRSMLVLIVAVSVLALTASAASAASRQTNGTGKLHHGGTFGFQAKADLRGSIEFHSPDGSLNVHCDGLMHYADWASKSGFPDTTFRSDTCTGADSVWVDALDKGEPGTGDKVKINVKTNGVSVYFDKGVIANGNVQILGG